MRILTVALVVSLLFSTSVLAADVPASAPKAAFGNTVCRDTVPCSGDSGYMPTEQLLILANKCITSSFGYTNTDGFFDDLAGLGRDDCLTAKAGVLPHAMGARLSPRCCIMKLNSGECRLNCAIVAE